jgi:glycine cleavage system H protein
MKLDPNARYQDTHEWARPEGGIYVCGITDYAQDSLSDVVYVELPEVGAILSKGEVFGVVESVKAASDLYMPMSGEIVEVNEQLEDEPEIVNDDPYGAGWMIKFKASDPGEWDSLLSGSEYQKVAEAEG